MSSKANVLAQINPTTTYVETKVKEVVNMEFKELTPEQFLEMFPKIKMTKLEEKTKREDLKPT